MRTVSASQLEQMMNSNRNLHLLDVLPSEKHREKHIPGSENVPFSKESDPRAFVQQVEKRVGDRKAPVVVYCASKQCDLSPGAARALEQAGFSDVVDFEGGLAEWEKSGKKLEHVAL
jgi:rhodanese-related sulfurtransferase